MFAFAHPMLCDTVRRPFREMGSKQRATVIIGRKFSDQTRPAPMIQIGKSAFKSDGNIKISLRAILTMPRRTDCEKDVCERSCEKSNGISFCQSRCSILSEKRRV